MKKTPSADSLIVSPAAQDASKRTTEELIVDFPPFSFSDILDIAELQRFQDLFADAHGVASVITDTEGKPITQPSRFTRLCEGIIRKTEKGRASCFRSDAVIGRYNPTGAVVQTCLSSGLWDAGVSITIAGKHVASWLIGQVRNEQINETQIMRYADEIGADKTDFAAALQEVPVMSLAQFQKIAELLFVYANELSKKAFNNLLLKKQIAENEKIYALLLEREENLATTLHSIGDGVISTDKNGLIVNMNPVAEKLCGWVLADAAGKSLTQVFNIVNSETRETVADPVKKVLQGGEVIGLANHTVLISKNGAEYQISDSAAPIRNKDGEICGVVMVFSDVTEKYAAQKMISDDKERYSSLLDSLETGIVVHAPDSSIVRSNPRATELLGLSSDQMMGRTAIDPAWKFIGEDYNPLLPEEYPVSRIISTNKPINNQILGIHNPEKGNIVWVTVNGVPILDNEGRITEIVISLIDITERKEAERALVESENRFILAMKASNDGLFDWNLETNSIYYSHGWKKMLGYEDHELPNDFSVWENNTEPDDVKKSWELQQKLISRQIDRFVMEFKMKHKDGHWVDILVRAEAIFNQSGKAIRIVGTHTDMTERKRMEKELAESAERFKALHNASFGGIAIHDKGVILDCNQGLSDMTGYSLDELIGMFGLLLITPEHRPMVLSNIVSGYEKPYEANGLRKNGEQFPMRLEARNIPYKGKSVRTVEFRDLTEQKLSEKKLKESEEDLKEAQRIARLGSWHLDIESNEVEWSEELYKIYGFDPSLPPPPYPEHQKLFTPESWERLSIALTKTAETGIPYELELNTISQNGTKGWMWVYGQTVVNENGVVTGLRGAAQDITERKRAEKEKEILTNQLNQAHKMELLGQLAGGVAHDFNNLLTVIMGYSAELSSNPELEAMAKQDAEEIFKAGARAKSLTQQLLTFSKKQVVQAIVLDLNELISNLQGVFDRLIGAHIKIFCLPSHLRAMVKADRIQIEQAVINLVLNSRDAMPGGGTVTIETSVMDHTASNIGNSGQLKDGKYVLLSVSDTGCGIPEELKSRLFEPFFTTKDKGRGLGLGLPNVISIVKSSGGDIRVESTPGSGTTFTILLPYCSEQTTSEDIGQIEKNLNGNGEQILIVEDEEALSGYFQKMILKLGYNVTVANSGAEALLLMEKGLQPALVLTDIIMPGMNGKDLADRILQKSPLQKIIFMSGFTDDIIKPLGVLGSSIPYIQKPFTATELATNIKTLLASH